METLKCGAKVFVMIDGKPVETTLIAKDTYERWNGGTLKVETTYQYKVDGIERYVAAGEMFTSKDALIKSL